MKGRVESVPTWHCSHTLQDLFKTRPSKKQPILPRIDFRPSESDLQQDVYGSSLPEAVIIDRVVLGSEARDLAQASGCACLARRYIKNLTTANPQPPERRGIHGSSAANVIKTQAERSSSHGPLDGGLPHPASGTIQQFHFLTFVHIISASFQPND